MLGTRIRPGEPAGTCDQGGGLVSLGGGADGRTAAHAGDPGHPRDAGTTRSPATECGVCSRKPSRTVHRYTGDQFLSEDGQECHTKREGMFSSILLDLLPKDPKNML